MRNSSLLSAQNGCRRPLFLWLVLFGFLSIGVQNALRVLGAVRNWQLLLDLGVQPGPIYIALTGGIFALAFFACAVLLAGWPKLAVWPARITSLAYAAWFWVDRMAVGPEPVGLMNWPFMAAITLLLLIFVLLSTLALRELDAG